MERSRVTADVTLPREPKQERSRRKQETLLASAAALFADPGFEHVTADEIAAHAGYGTGTFYNYFANKTQAFLMVAGQHETAVAPTLGALTDALAHGASLHAAAVAIVGQIMAERDQVPWLRRTWLRLVLTDDDVAAVQQRVDEEWTRAISEVLVALARSGRARFDAAAAPRLAVVIRSLVDSVVDEVVLFGTIEPEAAATSVADLLAGLVHSE